LTERERLILWFLGEGKTSKEIARAQGLSSKTIDACRRRLMRKLQVNSMAGLVKCAIVMEMTTAVPLPEQ
jgi:DNA-binding NarL/FixJ family response regulator